MLQVDIEARLAEVLKENADLRTRLAGIEIVGAEARPYCAHCHKRLEPGDGRETHGGLVYHQPCIASPDSFGCEDCETMANENDDLTAANKRLREALANADKRSGVESDEYQRLVTEFATFRNEAARSLATLEQCNKNLQDKRRDEFASDVLLAFGASWHAQDTNSDADSWRKDCIAESYRWADEFIAFTSEPTEPPPITPREVALEADCQSLRGRVNSLETQNDQLHQALSRLARNTM